MAAGEDSVSDGGRGAGKLEPMRAAVPGTTSRGGRATPSGSWGAWGAGAEWMRLQVPCLPEAADPECGRRGSGPQPAVKQALPPFPSVARAPPHLPGLGCLPVGSC